MSTSQPTLALPLPGRKPVLVDWDGGELSSHGGLLLVALADQSAQLAARLAAVATDPRCSEMIQRLTTGCSGRSAERPAAEPER